MFNIKRILLTRILLAFQLTSALQYTSVTLHNVLSFDLTRVLITIHLTLALPDA